MSANNKVKTAQISTLYIAIGGVFMIIATILSGYFAFENLSAYRGSLASSQFVSPDYLSLLLALLDSVAFGLSLFAAMLLLLRKRSHLAKVLMAIVLALGVATPLIHVLYPMYSESTFFLFALVNYLRWLIGLFLGLPLIVFCAAALVLFRLNRRLLQESKARWIPLPFAISGAFMIVASVMSVYVGMQALFLYGMNAANGSTSDFTYQALALGLLGLSAFGAALTAGKLLLNMQYVGLTIALAGLVLIFAPVMVALGYLLYDNAWAAIALTTTAFSIATLIIMGLNNSKLKQTVEGNADLENSSSTKKA